jgi:hypothetical protein
MAHPIAAIPKDTATNYSLAEKSVQAYGGGMNEQITKAPIVYHSDPYINEGVKLRLNYLKFPDFKYQAQWFKWKRDNLSPKDVTVVELISGSHIETYKYGPRVIKR